MSQQDDQSDSQSQNCQFSDDDLSSVESDYTPEWEDGTSKKVKYRVITEEKRKNLIELVHDQNVNIVKAAKKLGIKYSTAKTIYSVFLKEGRVVSKLKRGVQQKKNKTEVKKQKVPKNPKLAAPESVSGETLTQRRTTRNSERKTQKPYVEQTDVQIANPKKATTDLYEPPVIKKNKIASELQGEETIKLQTANIEAKELTIPPRIEEPKLDATIQNQILLAKLNSLQALQRSFLPQPPMFQLASPQMQALPKMYPGNLGLSGMNPLNLQMLQNMWLQQTMINPFQPKY